MRAGAGRRRAVAAALVLLLAAGGAAASGPPPYVDKIQFVPPNAEFPRLRWPDGSVSVNDRCPVSKTRIARDILPLWVNGRPVGFC